MSLQATSHLGDNTWAWLEDLSADLRDIGLDITVEPDVAPADADLLFACGLLTRVMIEAGHASTVVAAPVFPGESGGVYRSVIVARAADTETDLARLVRRRLAVNEYDSWSGWHAYRQHLRGRGLQPNRERIETGTHRASMQLVAERGADVAAIDSSIWNHHHDDPVRDRLVVVATTDDWPAPPLSIGPRVDADTRQRITERLRARPDTVPADAADYDRMLHLGASDH